MTERYVKPGWTYAVDILMAVLGSLLGSWIMYEVFKYASQP